MRIEYVPTLSLQRELCDMPRDMSRFKRYLWEMTHGTQDLVLPLVAFNPMGREHVAHALDAMIALDADAVVAEALRPAAEELPGDALLHSTLVLADDLGGMWSHRATNEFKVAYEWGPQGDGGWVLPGWWVSDEPSAAALTHEARRALYREAYRMAYGNAEDLTDVLLQEGFALRFDAPDAPVTADPHLLDARLRARDMPTLVAALFGDSAASELGYAPLGLPSYGGFEVARALAAASAYHLWSGCKRSAVRCLCPYARAMRMPHELEEFFAAIAASSVVGVAVAFVYWYVTGNSPWPGLILGEVIGFGWGAVILAISSPKRSD